MECYHFCQECKEHFDTADADGPNRTSFAASYLRGRNKKAQKEEERQRRQGQAWEDSTSAIGIHASNASKARKDLS